MDEPTYIDYKNLPDRVKRLAAVICETAFGDWVATGFDIKVACVKASEAAIAELDNRGWDLTMLDTGFLMDDPPIVLHRLRRDIKGIAEEAAALVEVLEAAIPVAEHLNRSSTKEIMRLKMAVSKFGDLGGT